MLDRTRAGAWVYRLPIGATAEERAARAAVLVAALLLLLYAALAAGPDRLVRLFRKATFAAGLLLPLLAFVLVPPAAAPAFASLCLLLAVVCAVLHRVLSRRRRPGAVVHGLSRARLLLELLGLALFGLCITLFLLDRRVPLAIAFWAFFALRLSIADLAYAGRLARELGLVESAQKDLRAAGRRRRIGRRLGALLGALAKYVLIGLWLALPVLAALARGEVSHGDWPPWTLALTWYPGVLLALSAGLLLVNALRLLFTSPLDAARGAAVAVTTVVYLLFVWRKPEFRPYWHALPGLFFVETLFAFVFGAALRPGAAVRERGPKPVGGRSWKGGRVRLE